MKELKKMENGFGQIFNSIASSPNGWTDADVARVWLEAVFDPETAIQAQGRKRLLILDGHNSHCTLEFVVYAARKNITVLLLPPHTTHCLQPLDVGVFGPLAREWRKKVDEWSKMGYKISKNTFLSIYSMARKEALTKDTICSAFKHCGIEPYNPEVISEAQIAPAESTSAMASQPIRPTHPPFMDVFTFAPEESSQSDVEICHSNHGDVDTENASQPEGRTLIALRDVTNLVTKRPLDAISMRRNNRPNPPSKYASKNELHTVVHELFEMLDEDDEAIAAGYAREVKKAKTTHLKTGARILTADASVAEMAKADRKKALAVVLKELKVIGKHRDRYELGLTREIEGKQLQREKAAIDAAAKRVKEAKQWSVRQARRPTQQSSGRRSRADSIKRRSRSLSWI